MAFQISMNGLGVAQAMMQAFAGGAGQRHFPMGPQSHAAAASPGGYDEYSYYDQSGPTVHLNGAQAGYSADPSAYHYAPSSMYSQAVRTHQLDDGTMIETDGKVFRIRHTISKKLEMSIVVDCPDYVAPPAEIALKPIEKEGYMYKLSYEKGFFGGDRWQKRYVVLTPSCIKYFSAKGGQLRGVIPFLPRGGVERPTMYRKDRFPPESGFSVAMSLATMNFNNNEYDKNIDKPHLIAMHKPAASRKTLMALPFFQSSDSSPSDSSRTYYFQAGNADEADAWGFAIHNNMRLYETKDEIDAHHKSYEEFRHIFLAAGLVHLTKDEIIEILNELLA